LIYLENSLFSWLEADEAAMGNLIDKTSISLFIKEFYRCKINLLFDTEEKVVSLKIRRRIIITWHKSCLIFIRDGECHTAFRP